MSVAVLTPGTISAPRLHSRKGCNGQRNAAGSNVPLV
jgi:hypothetical protein